MTQRHIYVTLTNATEGRDAEFNDWYSNHHMRETIERIPGFLSGRRYELNDVQRPWPDGRQIAFPYRYLGIYEIEMDDIGSIDGALKEIRENNPYTSHNGSLDPDHRGWVYTPTGQAHEDGKPSGKPRYFVTAFTNPAPGREEDFHTYYTTHIDQWVDYGVGYLAAERYVADPEQRDGQSAEWNSLATYEVEFDDIDQFHKDEVALMTSGKLTSANGAMDASDFWLWLFRPIGDEIVAS